MKILRGRWELGIGRLALSVGKAGLLAGVAWFLGLSVSAQAQEFPSKAPDDLPVSSVVLPKRVVVTLKNGLKIVMMESHRTPLITMQLVVRAGSIYDPADSPGLASAVANQLTAGTGTMTAFQIRVAAERLGGSLSATASQDYASIVAAGLGTDAKPLAALLADALLHPQFPEAELNSYKQLTTQGLIVQQQNPDFLASEQLAKTLFEGTRYGRETATPAGIQALTPASLKLFYQLHYSPTGAFLLVVGDFKAKAMQAILEKQFEPWKVIRGAVEALETPRIATKKGRKIYLVSRPGSVQSNILIGKTTLRRDDPAYYALQVTNHMLGGSSSSRLFNSVREQKGYAYSVSSRLAANALTGTFTASAQTRTAVTADALKEMISQMQKISDRQPENTELEAIKNNLAGNFVIGLTSQATATTYLFNVEQFNLPDDWLESFRDKILSVRSIDVQRTAQSLLQTDNLAIVVVGDANALRDSLKAVGEVIEVK